MMTVDRHRLIYSCVPDQFIFLIAEDEPMSPAWTTTGSRWHARRAGGGARDRAVAFREEDSRVDLVDLNVDDQDVVKIHSIYVRYLLPMTCELQYWEFTS
jgi:hypothetical protein